MSNSTTPMKRSPSLPDPPVDTGLIRCICPSTEDDGFTIQCERCLVWQHAFCVQITHATIPDHYLCDRCVKRKRPKLSKRIPISKKKLRKLDDITETPTRKRPIKSRIISRYVHPIFREARERWSHRWKQDDSDLHDHGPFVTMDAVTLLTKGMLMDTHVSNQGLFATRPIPALRYLMEVTGDVLLKSEFKFDPLHDFVILGTPLSHIMFYPTLDLCIDTRQFGNKARYIRRSCHPNAELRNIVLPQSREDKTVHLGLFARRLIEKDQEVTISWNWQRGHIAWKESMNWHHQHKQKHGQHEDEHRVIDEEEERRRKQTIQTMLDRFEKEFGVCACLNKRRCLIEQLKRQCAPPKEKPAYKLSTTTYSHAVKSGRRKSSIILLKPKPYKEKLKSQDHTDLTFKNRSVNLLVSNASSNTPKETQSEDELLDVEGDIDIGDDMPPLSSEKYAPPLLDDHSSDEENADLSSLSSLSSLSVFEESGNENSNEEENNRSNKKQRRKKAMRHSRSFKKHHHTSMSSTSIPSPQLPQEPTSSPKIPVEKPPTLLPRKKLWMRDYLSKHVTEQVKKSMPEESATTSKTEESSTIVETDQLNNTQLNSYTISLPATDIEEKRNIESTDDAVKTGLQTETVPEDIPMKDQNVDVMQEKCETDETKDDIDVFDINDGELSDASTILLDDEELRHVYNRSEDGHPSKSTAPEVLEKANVDHNSSTPIIEVSNNKMETEIMDLDDIPTRPIEESMSGIPNNAIDFTATEDDKKKLPVKKISLQEYLSSKHQ